ncbi:uncharacterized protein LOC129593828 [Paramacrobiotus metropolitanus]|uniref:uncharacterized protein LOC129593828 n=1 Tax=Paramacrobiotus metropolitanus TaxID=2943436 RepID=UPI002445E5E6|nr:uncharacterized protein LOC129593828 [Paramacrobiotus metropolitanus]
MAQPPSNVRTVDEIRAYFDQRYGAAINLEGSLLEIADSWKELEADPSLFYLLASDLAGEEIDIVEIYDIDCDLQSTLGTEEKIYGLIFLFECKAGGNDRAQRLYNKELQKKFFNNEHFVTNEMFFAHQKAPNSCATHALLSIMLNSPDLPLNALLRDFKDFTKQMSPEDRGYAIQNHCQFAAFHNRRAPATPEIVSTVMNLSRTGESSRSYRKTETRQNHFVPYVPINGQLMELDGLKDYPILHDEVSEETFLRKARDIIKERIRATNDNKFSFAILAVKGSKRTRCIREVATIDMRQSSLMDQLTNSVEDQEKQSFLPPECAELRKAFRERTPLPYEPKNVPNTLPTPSTNLSPLCHTISGLLAALQEKHTADTAAQKKLVETYSQRVLPVKNGYLHRDPSPEVFPIKRAASLSLSSSRSMEHAHNSFPIVNGFCKGKGALHPPVSTVIDDLPSIAAVWPMNVALPMESDVSTLQDVQALPAEFLRRQTKKQRVTRTRRTDAPLSAPAKTESKDVLPLSKKRSVPDQNGPRSPKSRRKNDNIISDYPTDPCNSSGRSVKSECEARTNGGLVSLVTRFTRMSGQLQSSTVMTPSRSSTSVEDRWPRPAARVDHGLPVVCGKNSVDFQMDCHGGVPRLTRSLSSQHPLDQKPQVGHDRNGYVSIVKNPLTEAKSKLTVLEEQSALVSETRTVVQQFAELELKRTDLIKIIVEENHKRVEIYNNAVRREFDYANPMMGLLKRFFEYKLFTAEELGLLFPAGASTSSAGGGPSSSSSSSAERDGPRTPTLRNGEKS